MTDSRKPADLRREIQAEREQLAAAVDSLRGNMDVTKKLRGNLPVLAAGALAAGFVIAGGVGATARLVFRRGREGTTKARVGRFSLIGKD